MVNPKLYLQVEAGDHGSWECVLSEEKSYQALRQVVDLQVQANVQLPASRYRPIYSCQPPGTADPEVLDFQVQANVKLLASRYKWP
jgi:hypothetical protein